MSMPHYLEAQADHDDIHDDPTQVWGECQWCADRIEIDQENGIRCQHGQLIPYLKDKKHGWIATDIECTDCQIDYGPDCFHDWNSIQERELSHATA